MRTLRSLMIAALVVAGSTACSDKLTVVNQNDADIERLKSRPSDLEALIAASYNIMHRNTLGSNNILTQLYALGMENYSNLANFGMGTRSQIPRPPINNERNNPTANENYNPYLGLHRAARQAAIGLSVVNAPGFAFQPASASQIARSRAFGHFVIGIALGQVAMIYDSGAAVSWQDNPIAVNPLALQNYDALGAYALASLDSAILYAGSFAGQTVPSTWMRTAVNVSQANFIALVRGWQARIRAGIARTPTERGAVNWTQVVADAGAFVAAWPADFVQSLDPALGWTVTWVGQMYASNSVNWHQVWGFMAGMAGNQAGYDAWLSTPVALRTPYAVVSADLRWPQGATRAAQQADASARRYVNNRASGNDWFGDPLGNSQYRWIRFFALRNASTIGPFPSITTTEIRMLQAEGEYENGNYAAAAGLVDVTRADTLRGGLPGLVANGVVDAVTLVPGGASCVPRIPVAPFNVSACGTLLEAIKYEKRIEMGYTTTTGWYTDSRGWGDLPIGTPLHFPVPYQEMDARLQVFYSLGGSGQVGGAPLGNYGL